MAISIAAISSGIFSDALVLSICHCLIALTFQRTLLLGLPVIYSQCSPATNSLEWGGIAVFLILFFWQHPHFYSIAYMYKEDYKKAGLQMLPVIDNGIKRTVLHIFLHALRIAIFTFIN